MVASAFGSGWPEEAGAGSTLDTLVRVLKAMDATNALNTLVPEPQVSPLALLRSARPRRRVSTYQQ